MGKIQANTGLITGIDITGTVEKLIALQAKPRDLLNTRLTELKAKQTAVADLTATVIGVQLAAKGLSTNAAFESVTVTSADSNLLTAAASASNPPTAGVYQFTPLRLAQAQQLSSGGFVSKTAALGGGTLTIREGGRLDEAVPLAELNGGEGVPRGKIKITDRSGTSAVIDLRFAQDIDDVLEAINANETIDVKATTVGDRIQLTDSSGRTTANLRVQEVNGGTTAAGLGLSSIDVAATSALGSDVVRLSEQTSLSRLNDGNGLSFNKSLSDLRITFRDGSTPLDIDFHRTAKAESYAIAQTDAASGINADIQLTALTKGSSFDGYELQFIDSGAVVQGSETVALDTNAKTITVDIDAGSSTADDVIEALNAHAPTRVLFVASHGTGGDGSGVVTLTDEATSSGGAAIEARSEATLAQLVQTINEADPTRLQASISADGDRLELTDLTTDDGDSFTVSDLNGGSLVHDLGLTTDAVDDVITGGRLVSGLKTTLLRSLNGGRGLGDLGTIDLTDRSGATATVNLASAQTIDDVITAINASGVGVKASLNAAGDGVQLVDTTGATTSNLIVADGDANDAATKLGIAINAATTKSVGSSLHRQTVNESTLLADFNRGTGVTLGSFAITDSTGATSAVNLKTLNAETVGDVIDAVNGLSIGVEASLNDTGDGIKLVDTAGGTGKLSVRDVGTGTAAANLKLVGTSTTVDVNGTPTEILDGTTTVSVTLDSDDSLQDLVTKINALSPGVKAAIATDNGAVNPYRLTLSGVKTGKSNALVIDGSGLNLNLTETVAARDALVAVGASGTSLGVLVSSASNTVEDAASGINVMLKSTSTNPVSVTVAANVSSISAKVKAFVDQFNKLKDKVDAADFYQAENSTKGVLYASSETLRIESDFNRVLSGRFFTASSLQSLESIGVSFTQEGKLSFDTTKFAEVFEERPEDVKKFFADETKGFAKKVDEVTERLAGIENSVLINQTVVLQKQVEITSSRISDWTLRLDLSKTRLLTQFYNLESIVGKLQNTFGAVQSTLANSVELSKST